MVQVKNYKELGYKRDTMDMMGKLGDRAQANIVHTLANAAF